MLARKALAGTAAAPKVYVEDVFSTYLYTGNGSTQTITNGIDLSGEGGLVWTKSRNLSGGHALIDTVRGTGKQIGSNSTDAEKSANDTITAFNNSGYSLGADSTYGNVNISSSYNYASWTFRKAKKFFDIVTYTGNGTAGRTISHNLGSVPGCIIIKRTSDDSGWAVYHRSLNVANNESFQLNSSIASFTTEQYWNNTAPTSTEITLGTNATVNGNGSSYVAYVFAHDAGGFGDAGSDSIIKCSSFTCDGSGNATIDLGWEPQFVILKRKDATENWELYDNMRGLTVSSGERLRPSATDAEVNSGETQITNTGFKRVAVAANSTYIYIAIRRGPMKTPTVGTSVFSPVAYTGTSAAQTITTNFPVDMFWNKTRVAGPGSLMDRTRGQLVLRTEADYSESAIGTYSSTTNVWRNNTGLSFGASGADGLNADGTTAVIEAFRRAPGFFDVVCYTGTGANTTINHNLGAVPEFIIVKRRNATAFWYIYHSSVGNTKTLQFNTAVPDTSNSYWNATSPTSTTFSLGTASETNTSGGLYVAYLFGSVTGVSKVGTYTGTGTTLQVNCGFTAGARLVLIKRTDNTGDWYVWDTARGIVSGNDPYLLMNSQNAEVTNTDYIDTYSAGFEISSTAPAAINANGGTFIYLAIA